MNNLFGQKRWIVVFIAVIVLALMMSWSLFGRDNLTLPERIIHDVTAVVQSTIQKPAHYVAGLFADVRNINNIYSENKILKQKLNSMAHLEAELAIVTKENMSLRNLLALQESLADYDSVNALVIARSPDRWEQMLTINRGSAHGIERNMAVITDKGLLGKIYSTSRFSSRVILITDSTMTGGIAAELAGKDSSFGIVDEFVPGSGYLLMSMIQPDIQLERGDIVVSSGLGGVYPRGLVIGHVESLRRTEDGLTQTVYVKPIVDTQLVKEVSVISRILIVDELIDEVNL